MPMARMSEIRKELLSEAGLAPLELSFIIVSVPVEAIVEDTNDDETRQIGMTISPLARHSTHSQRSIRYPIKVGRYWKFILLSL